MKRIVLIALLALTSGCVSQEVNKTAVQLRVQLQKTKACSRVNSDKPEDQKVYDDAWAEALRSADALVKASQ